MKRMLSLLLVAAALTVPAAAAGSPSLQLRHADFAGFPSVRVTLLAPPGVQPTLFENGHPAAYVNARQLGSAEALVLAVDNSRSMQGRPLTEAKRAAREFLAHGQRASGVGLVAFGHDALALTRRGESSSDVIHKLNQLAPDAQIGTALYDAVATSVLRLTRISDGARILVLLTDGHDVGSHTSLEHAITAAQRADVAVYVIAAGTHVERETLERLSEATGGRFLEAGNVGQLTAIYTALGQELNRTWRLSYLTSARPGDSLRLTARAGALSAPLLVRVPGAPPSRSGLIPAAIADSPMTAAAIVALAALLLAGAVALVIRQRRTPEIKRLLDPHLQTAARSKVKRPRRQLFEPLVNRTESALGELSAWRRLGRLIERSGLTLSIGAVPYLAGAAALCFGLFGAVIGVGSILTIALMLVGLASPLLVFSIAARRRTKAFDRQLPDVLATVASTLRAGHGLRTAMRAVSEDGSPPASQEFSRVLGEERLGRPLGDAITAMCERIGSEDLEYVATAIKVHSQAGGSLATIFDTLSETVRERQRHARKVRALTSMGRMSAMVLTCLPFALAFIMTTISPHYMAPFYKTSSGQALIVFSIISMGIGGLLLRRIVNVRY